MTLLVEEIIDRANWSAEGIRLRWPDEEECAAGGMTAAQALEGSVRRSSLAWEVRSCGELVGIWGYLEVDEHTAEAWLLTTSAIHAHSRDFIRTSAALCASLRTTYPTLTVLCHNNHTAARRWLAWLGFHPAATLKEFTTWAT